MKKSRRVLPFAWPWSNMADAKFQGQLSRGYSGLQA